MSQLSELTRKLKEIFQIDRADLDFGIYRILNTRSQEIERYLTLTLPNAVKKAFGSHQNEQLAQWQSELAQAQKQAQALGADPSQLPKIQELQQKIAQCKKSSTEMEAAVYRHLLTFFSRYYEEGDFISQRRYKGDTYAVPYSGEEVLLHWANKDQYYTKSGENFSNYRFTLEDGRTVFLRLNSADIAKDNRKDNNAKRLFTLATEQTIERENDEGEIETLEIIPISQSDDGQTLTILFDYRLFEKSAKQDKILAQDLTTILANHLVQTHWPALNERMPTEKNPNRTLLEKHLSDYTQKNTADYFIHKDLGGFLRRELDFYIKNEVMNLDELQTAVHFAHIESNLRLIQTLRTIALEIIGFLAQLENFQKKLWLKKKFIANHHYLITLNHILALPQADSFITQITNNEKQLEQWQNLFNVEPQQAKMFLAEKNNHVDFYYLVVDTSLFPATFQSALLSALSRHFADFDSQINGTLIHSDNFQALNLLQERYREQVKCIYIDPPYNTHASPIIYKNEYRHSSWISLMQDRIFLGLNLAKSSAIQFTAIDHAELFNLGKLQDVIFAEQNRIAIIPIQHNPKGRNQAVFFSENCEYMFCYAKDITKAKFNQVAIDAEVLETFTEKDQKGKYRWENFIRARTSWSRKNKPNNWYPIYISPDLSKISLEDTVDYIKLYPRTDSGDFAWKVIPESFLEQNKENGYFKVVNENGKIVIYHKYYEQQVFKNFWSQKKYQSEFNGTNLLKAILGKSSFSFPKSIFTVLDSIKIVSSKDDTILDYFAGSGTTAHAVINLNREDGGNRQYILVEQGEYFDTVLKPRVQKVIYSKGWKDGKPTLEDKADNLQGVPQIVKVLKLESYEDTLNNLELQRSGLFDHLLGNAKQDYLLHYMLDVESRDSLLNIRHFDKPFDYGLNISTNSAGAYQWQAVDLVETFHYLLGARVISVDDKRQAQGFVAVECRLPNQSADEKTLIFWRDCERIGYGELQAHFDRLSINPTNSEYSQIYLNGDHTLETAWDGEQSGQLKILSIEDAFLSCMFEGEN
ncbi:site-specific DNA-methyltransferase [Bisgaard Taxon 45]